MFKPRFLHLFEYYGDLEKWVRGNSSSFKMVQFESLDTVSYSPTVVTMALSWALSCIVCDIERREANVVMKRILSCTKYSD